MTKKGKIKAFSLFLAFLLLIAAVGAVSAKTVIKTFYPLKYSDLVGKYAAEYGVDEILLYSVIKTESSFNPDAVSYANAIGLTQITEETFDWIKSKIDGDEQFSDLFTEENSIKYGAFLLGYLVDEFENTETALAAYHAGRGRVNQWLSDPEISPDGKTLAEIPIDDTAHYVRKVTRAMNIYKNLYFKEA